MIRRIRHAAFVVLFGIFGPIIAAVWLVCIGCPSPEREL
jgi:hypothetical protein